jgi:DNA ligase 4
LFPIIRKYVPVNQCILDGELLVWDTITQRFEEFGKLKTLGWYCIFGYVSVLCVVVVVLQSIMMIDEIGWNLLANEGQDATENLGKQLCYIVFDLLYVNGQNVMDLTLAQRMILLNRCIPKPQPRMLEIVTQAPVTSLEDIISYVWRESVCVCVRESA